MWSSDEESGSRRVVAIGKKNTDAILGSPKGVMCMGYVDFSKDGHLSSTESNYTFFVSKIGSERFMNKFDLKNATETFIKPDKTIQVWNVKGVKGYELLKYEVTKDKLTIWDGDPREKALAKVIENKKLVGTVKWDDKREDIVSAQLTDSTDNIAAFLKNGGSAQLFPDSVRLPGDLKGTSCKTEYRRLHNTIPDAGE